MRKVAIGLGVALVLLAVALGLAAANLETWINRNRDALADRAQARLGRELSFGEVGIGLAAGLVVRVADLRIGGDPAFSKEDLLRAEAVEVRVKLLPALFGKLEVGRVVLRKPSIHVIRTERGLSTDSLGAAGGAPGRAASGGGAPALWVSLVDVRDGTIRWEDRTAKPPVDLRAEQLDVRASDLGFTEPIGFELEAAVFGSPDRNARVVGTVGPLQADVPRAELQLRLDPVAVAQVRRLAPLAAALPGDLAAEGDASVSLDASGTLADLRFDARVDAKEAALRYGESFRKPAGRPLELTLAGERRGDAIALGTVDLRVDRTALRGQATVQDLDRPRIEFSFRSDSLELASFGAAEPGAPDALRELRLTGKASLPEAGARLSAALRSPAGSLGGTDYRDLALDLTWVDGKAEIQRLSARAFDGEVTATGQYDTQGPQPRFELRTHADGVRVEKVLASPTGRSGAPLRGALAANLALRGGGSGWPQIKTTLTGDGTFSVRDGVMEDLNPAGETMRSLIALPSFSDSGLARFVEGHPKLFGVGDTPFEDLAGTIDVRNGWVHLKGLELDAGDYAISGEGRYSFDNEVDFRTRLRLSAALSEELLAAVPRMRYLRARDGRVEVPVAFRGAPPRIAAVPDVSRLAEGAAREALTDLLGKALGAPKPTAPKAPGEPATAPAPPSDAPAPVEKPAPAEEPAAPPTAEELGSELLRRGLDELLRRDERKQP
jgi:uncharacterized protein involved in outer membrane biogenesis